MSNSKYMRQERAKKSTYEGASTVENSGLEVGSNENIIVLIQCQIGIYIYKRLLQATLDALCTNSSVIIKPTPLKLRRCLQHLCGQMQLLNPVPTHRGIWKKPCTSNGASRDKNPGYAFLQQNFSYSSDLHLNHKKCGKNPNHTDFIPINDFCVDHLPEGLKIPKLLELIRLKAELTVRLIILHTSRCRPQGLEVNTPANGTRFGTGTVFPYKLENIELCNCSRTGHQHSISGPFLVVTAGHVVFDDDEARNTDIEFFFDSGDRRGIVLARGYRVVEIDVKGNRSIIECRTHDLNLYRRLKENYEQRQRLIDSDLESKVNGLQTVVVISHPHGASKHVTVGTLQEKKFVSEDVRSTEDGMKLRECILKYDAPTCPGSGGGSVNVIGGGTTVSAFAPHCSSKVGHGNLSGIGWATE